VELVALGERRVQPCRVVVAHPVGLAGVHVVDHGELTDGVGAGRALAGGTREVEGGLGVAAVDRDAGPGDVLDS